MLVVCLTAAQGDCPACQGAVRWGGQCPVCRGTGRIDGRPRHGVSVFPTSEGLYHYMVETGGDIEDRLVVELEAQPAGDVDFDADHGAMLVVPTAIGERSRFDPHRAARVRHRAPAYET